MNECEQCACSAPDGSERCGDCLACKVWSDGCDLCNPQSGEEFTPEELYDIGGEG